MPRMLMQLGKEIRPMGLICFVWLFSFLRVAFCLDFVDSCVVLHVKKKKKNKTQHRSTSCDRNYIKVHFIMMTIVVYNQEHLQK